MAQQDGRAVRAPLSRERVLRTAVELADEQGLDAVSMRRLAERLGVVPMALYKHVANKDQLLDGMVDLVVAGIAPPPADAGWKDALRARVLAAREAMLRHPWARRVLEAQAAPTPVLLAYTDATIAVLLRGGLSVDLVHHAMHALGSRAFGFTQELHQPGPGPAPAPSSAVAAQLAAAFPHVVAVATSRPHDAGSVVGAGCDDRFEFEFGLDLLLDGVERLHAAGWSSSADAG
ncbi:TetR/AcrR family transcriptional regulator [Cellulomonas sp. NPDC057328]|uniref:TetR/AcrR family transcriptional regulator n=1 Tax=Cellulomonas sp. NPDC057328 TaxID=3346101 RepID=UPI00363E044D